MSLKSLSSAANLEWRASIPSSVRPPPSSASKFSSMVPSETGDSKYSSTGGNISRRSTIEIRYAFIIGCL